MCIEIAGARPMLPKVRILIGFDARQTGSQQQRLLCNEKCARGRLFIVGKGQFRHATRLWRRLISSGLIDASLPMKDHSVIPCLRNDKQFRQESAAASRIAERQYWERFMTPIEQEELS